MEESPKAVNWRRNESENQMSDVSMKCPHCGQILEVPEGFLGQTLVCPLCECDFELPNQTLTTIDCPFCGESVLATMKKCKHCGEFLKEKKPELEKPSPKEHSITTSQTQSSASPQTAPSSSHRHARCPKCGSTSIQAVKKGFGGGKGCVGYLITGLPGLLCGLCGANKMSSVCMQCGYKWKIGK